MISDCWTASAARSLSRRIRKAIAMHRSPTARARASNASSSPRLARSTSSRCTSASSITAPSGLGRTGEGVGTPDGSISHTGDRTVALRAGRTGLRLVYNSPMRHIGAYEAKTHLPRLLDEVEAGESITITKHGRPVAVLVPARRERDAAAAAAGALISFRRRHSLGGV